LLKGEKIPADIMVKLEMVTRDNATAATER
jgi:hypothetical protein